MVYFASKKYSGTEKYIYMFESLINIHLAELHAAITISLPHQSSSHNKASSNHSFFILSVNNTIYIYSLTRRFLITQVEKVLILYHDHDDYLVFAS